MLFAALTSRVNCLLLFWDEGSLQATLECSAGWERSVCLVKDRGMEDGTQGMDTSRGV